MSKMYLTKEGYNQYLDEVRKLKDRFKELEKTKKSAYYEAPGDGWHDNFVFEDLVRKEDNLLIQIDKLTKLEKDIVIIEPKKNNKDIVDITDRVELELTYGDLSMEVDIFELNANYYTKHEQEISVNSKLGSAIYLKKINSTVKYEANNQTITVKIIRKVSSKDN